MVHKIIHDKRTKRTRTWLFETLLQLLEEKAYAEITVTELTEKADIARQTFYRNYQNMDDILLSKMDEILDEYLDRVQESLQAKEDPFWNYEVTQLVRLWQRNESLFKALQKAGLSFQVLEKLTDFFALFHKKIQNLEMLDDKHRYLVYYLAGGVYLVLHKWFENDMDTPETLLTDLFKKAARNVNQIAEEYIHHSSGENHITSES